MSVTGRDTFRQTQSRNRSWNIPSIKKWGGRVAQLAVVVRAPSPNRALWRERQRMIAAGFDRTDNGQTGDRLGRASIRRRRVAELALSIRSPAHDRSIRTKNQAKRRADGNRVHRPAKSHHWARHEIDGNGWIVAELTVEIISPRPDAA